MNYFENLLNKGAELQLLDEKMLMKKRSISSLKELRKKINSNWRSRKRKYRSS